MVGRPCGVRYALILRHFQPKTKLRAYANPARLGTVHHNGLADASGSAHGESLARSRTGWPPTAPLRGYPGDHPHPPHPALRAGIAGCFGGGGLGHHRQCPANPLERLREDTVARLHERLDLLAVYGDNGQRTVLAVVDRVDTSAEQMLRESRLVTDGLAPSEAPTLVARLREGLNGGGEPAARKLSEDGNQLLDHAAEALDRMALRG